jgi:hypothetical protein
VRGDMHVAVTTFVSRVSITTKMSVLSLCNKLLGFLGSLDVRYFQRAW